MRIGDYNVFFDEEIVVCGFLKFYLIGCSRMDKTTGKASSRQTSEHTSSYSDGNLLEFTEETHQGRTESYTGNWRLRFPGFWVTAEIGIERH